MVNRSLFGLRQQEIRQAIVAAPKKIYFPLLRELCSQCSIEYFAACNVDFYDKLDIFNFLKLFDYYPFGMQMPGRIYYADTAKKYRYGFNGKEMDNDTYGQGNEYDYGFRIYNPRIGRFLSVDPITRNYPELTPYQFASNRPVDGIDLDGLEYMQGRVSIYGLHQFRIVSQDYILRDLWIKNSALHEIVLEHEKAYKITHDIQLDEDADERDMVVDVNTKGKSKTEMKREMYWATNKAKQLRNESVPDIASGSEDLIKWGINTYFLLKNTQEMAYCIFLAW